MKSKTIVVSPNQMNEGNLLSVMWAQNKIEGLAAFAEMNKEELVAVGKGLLV